jgi:hypothetical protein
MVLNERSPALSVRGMLDWELPCALRIVLLGLVMAIPAGYVLGRYSPQTGFTSLILFGADVQPQPMPEVKACHPAVMPGVGYDGEFYAQVAIDPTLRNPHLKDGIAYPECCSTRILLPVLAYVGGGGDVCRILQVFAVLNLLFWLPLLFGMVHYLRPRTVREYLCLVAAVLTSGAMFSVARSLTDLPAATLAFYSAACSGSAAVATMALALLTKETYLLSLPRLLEPVNRNRRAVAVMAVQLAVAVLPLAVWYTYTHLHFGFRKFDAPNTSWPGAGLIDYLGRAWRHWYPNRIFSPRLSQELLAPISLLVQVGYLLWRRDYKSPYWRMGIGFAIGFLLLSPDVFIDQYSFTRDVIPLTLAFNIGLMKEKRAGFLAWFIAGNVGLLSGTREMLLFLR